MTVELQTHADGVLLSVKAQAGARDNSLRSPQAGALRVAVTQAAEKGKANKAIVALLSKRLGLRKSQIQVFSGATSPSKKLLVSDITDEELKQRIEAALS